MIISVGYRVRSVQGTQFRIWATQRIKEYIVKGFTLDDERLKQGGQKAIIEYGKYRAEQSKAMISDFDLAVKELEELEKKKERE